MRHKYCFNELTAAVIGIVFLWSTSPEKNRPHRTLHTPSRVDQSFREDWITCLTHSTRRWSPVDDIADVIITMSALADIFSLRHLADVIIVVDRWLWLCCWPLTFFSELTFCSPSAHCPIFQTFWPQYWDLLSSQQISCFNFCCYCC